MWRLSEKLLGSNPDPTHTCRDWRELLPLPRLRLLQEGENAGAGWCQVLGVPPDHLVSSLESNALAWTIAAANGLNVHYARGLVSGMPTAAQWKCLWLLFESCRYMCALPMGTIPCEDWAALLTKKAVYTGEILDHGEHLIWSRVEAGLPPYQHCAAVDAVRLADGAVREYLCNPEKAVFDVASHS
eukprot:5326007-Amphidinium_carterae.4